MTQYLMETKLKFYKKFIKNLTSRTFEVTLMKIISYINIVIVI